MKNILIACKRTLSLGPTFEPFSVGTNKQTKLRGIKKSEALGGVKVKQGKYINITEPETETACVHRVATYCWINHTNPWELPPCSRCATHQRSKPPLTHRLSHHRSILSPPLSSLYNPNPATSFPSRNHHSPGIQSPPSDEVSAWFPALNRTMGSMNLPLRWDQIWISFVPCDAIPWLKMESQILIFVWIFSLVCVW